MIGDMADWLLSMMILLSCDSSNFLCRCYCNDMVVGKEKELFLLYCNK